MSRFLPGQPLGIKWGQFNPAATTIEVFVDFVCPFSNRIVGNLKEVAAEYGDQVNIVFFIVPQPWHPQGSIIAECFLAAASIAPESTSKLLTATFDAFHTNRFQDVPSYDMSRHDFHKAFAELYNETCGVPPEKLLEAVEIKQGTGEFALHHGNGATRLLKFYVKLHRQLGVHVT